MRLLGYDLAGESGATGPGGAARAAGVAPERTRLAVSPVLLNEVLELQEALLEARASGDAAAVRRLAGEVQGRLVDALASVARGLAGRADAMQPAREGDGDMLVVDTFAEKKEELDAVAEQLIAIRYLQRFLDEIDASAPQDEAAPPAASGGVPTPPGSA